MTELETLRAQLDEQNRKMDLLLSMFGSTIKPQAECKYTLHVWLEEWYTTYKVPALKSSGLRNIRNCMEKYIKTNFADKKLNEITALEVQQNLQKIPTTRMRKYTYDTLGAALKKAYKLEILPDNVMARTDSVKHTRTVGHALTVEEQNTFMQLLRGNPKKRLYQFYLLTGCRLAEALSVKWVDVDWENERIKVTGTKTKNAERFVPLFPQTKKLLEKLPRESDLVFPYSVNSVKLAFDRLRKKHNLNFSIHSLRHTFATRCLKSKIAHNTVQKWMGHAKASTTMDTYSHVQPDFEAEEVKKYNSKLRL